MAIIRWKPFYEIDELFDELTRSKQNGWDLAADVSEDDKSVTVEMHVPGVDVDKLDVHVEGNHLYVHGSREEKEEKKDKHFFKKEIRRGSFERIISLPCPVESENIQATFENGVLKIVLPKEQPRAKSKKINIIKK
ncbi:MAG: Hsp20/alpha crystallin family protein [Candidatus Dependentiae bacterium]